MRAKFRGVSYKIKVRPIRGKALALTSDPKGRKPRIVFEPEVVGNLEVLIHEALHACFFDLDEDSVEQAGRDITKFLGKMGKWEPR